MISEAPSRYYMRPHAHSDVAAADIEHLSQEASHCLTRETFKERRLDVFASKAGWLFRKLLLNSASGGKISIFVSTSV